MGLLLRQYRPTAQVVVGAAPDPGPDREPAPDPGPDPEPGRPPGRSLVGRIVRALVVVTLAVLLAGEAVEGVRTAQVQARRSVDRWWSDVERRSRRATRHAEIGWLASRIRAGPGARN